MGKKKAKKAAARAVHHTAEMERELKGSSLLQRKLEDAPFGSDPDDWLIAVRDAMVRVMDLDTPRLGYIDRRVEDTEARLTRVEVALISQAETLAALSRVVLDDRG